MTKRPQQIGSRKSINRSLHSFGLSHNELSDVAKLRFKVGSMSELTDDQMYELYDEIRNKTPYQKRPRAQSKKPKPKRGSPVGPNAIASKKQIDYIRDLRPKVAGMINDETFRMWVANSFRFLINPKNLSLLTNGQAMKIIPALVGMSKRK